jgi:hypothetical protein
VRLIAVTVDQHAKNDLTELAKHLADRLEAGYRTVRWGRPHE